MLSYEHVDESRQPRFVQITSRTSLFSHRALCREHGTAIPNNITVVAKGIYLATVIRDQNVNSLPIYDRLASREMEKENCHRQTTFCKDDLTMTLSLSLWRKTELSLFKDLVILAN